MAAWHGDHTTPRDQWPTVFTTDQVARVLGVSPRTVRRLVEEKRLPALPGLHRTIRIAAPVLARYLDGQP